MSWLPVLMMLLPAAETPRSRRRPPPPPRGSSSGPQPFGGGPQSGHSQCEPGSPPPQAPNGQSWRDPARRAPVRRPRALSSRSPNARNGSHPHSMLRDLNQPPRHRIRPTRRHPTRRSRHLPRATAVPQNPTIAAHPTSLDWPSLPPCTSQTIDFRVIAHHIREIRAVLATPMAHELVHGRPTRSGD